MGAPQEPGESRNDRSASLAGLFPALVVPDGLTLNDLARAARLVNDWQDEEDLSGGEWTAIPLVAKSYRLLASAAQERKAGTRDREA